VPYVLKFTVNDIWRERTLSGMRIYIQPVTLAKSLPQNEFEASYSLCMDQFRVWFWRYNLKRVQSIFSALVTFLYILLNGLGEW